MARRRQPPDPEHQVDLHRHRSVEQALTYLERELRSCAARGIDRLLVITGRGAGNRDQIPVLAPAVRRWLTGPDGKRLGVRAVEPRHKGGALLVLLGQRRKPSEG
jgi:DNA-nicking Smr family endonuclease